MAHEDRNSGRPRNGNSADGRHRQPRNVAGQGQPDEHRTPSDVVTSPSRFARIPRFVHYPKWGPLVSHDAPFKDGHNGEIAITITAGTPLMVGKGRDKTKEPGVVLPFRAPDGSFAIPGSSLQGLIRSILTVATFGKLGPAVHDRRYAVRDIGPTETAKAVYAKQVTHGTGNSERNAIQVRAKAAWLIKGPEGICLVPCDGYARASFAQIAAHRFPNDTNKREYLENFLARTRNREPRDESRDAPARYEALIGSCRDFSNLQVKVRDHGQVTTGGHGWKRNLWIESRHCSLGEGVDGTIVITGKPSTGNEANGGKKHREFVFFGPDRKSACASKLGSIKVPTDIWRDFLLIHEPESGSGEKINPNWDFWKGEFKAGEPVPMFYLEEEGQLKAMGTAQMFKLAMPLSTHDMLSNSAPEHVSKYDGDPREETGKLDLASLIFGATGGSAGNWFRHNLKRRASFDMARVARGKDGSSKAESVGPVPLLSPKPSYYPIYVRQSESGAGRQHGARQTYATYTSLPGENPALASPELSGVKIWPAAGRQRKGFADGVPNNVLSQLDTVPAETKFTTKLRIHNLREVELGALLWALTFGNRQAFASEGPIVLRHRLGGGKPYGLGEVEIRVSAINLQRNDNETVKDGPSIVGKFIEYMDPIEGAPSQKWVDSNQVRSLIKAATVQDYSGADALEYIHGAATKESAKRHADLRNGLGQRDPWAGGQFLPAYADGWEAKRSPPPQGGAPNYAAPAAAPQRPAPRPTYHVEEDAPVRHRDGREGIIREIMRGACKVSVNGQIELWHLGDFVVTGPPDE